MILSYNDKGSYGILDAELYYWEFAINRFVTLIFCLVVHLLLYYNYCIFNINISDLIPSTEKVVFHFSQQG